MAERQAGRHRRPPESQATYREVFAVGEFRALWLAQALSFIGDQLAQVALAVLVYERTRSPLLTALAYALTYIPSIVGGPVLSGLADLFPRRRVMVVCDVLRAALVAVMALLNMPFWGLCVLVFLTVLMGAPFSAARAAVLPDVLDGDRYVAGSAISNITHQGTQILGFLAGGAMVAVVGTRGALALDAVTFVASAVILLAGLRARPAPKRRERQSLGLLKGTWEGGRLVFGDRTLRALVSFAWLCGFYVIPEGLAAPYAATFGGGAVTVGLLMSAMPIGMVIGAFLFSRCVRPTNRIRSMGWMSILACAPLLGAAASPPLWTVVSLWALSGIGSAYQLAANAAFVAAVPASGRGQAFGLAQSGILAGQGLGILIGGAAAQVLGPETVVAFAGALGLAVAATLTFSWNQIRGGVIVAMRERAAAAPPQKPEPEPEPEPESEPESEPETESEYEPEPEPEPSPDSPPTDAADGPALDPDVLAGVERVSSLVSAHTLLGASGAPRYARPAESPSVDVHNHGGSHGSSHGTPPDGELWVAGARSESVGLEPKLESKPELAPEEDGLRPVARGVVPRQGRAPEGSPQAEDGTTTGRRAGRKTQG